MAESFQLSILDERPRERRLTFTQKFFVLIAALFGVCVLLFGLFVLSAVMSHRDREISGELVLSPEWVEVTPDKPLSFPKRSQGIVLYIAEPLVPDNLDLTRPRLTDGTLIRPEVQLVEQDGSVADVELLRAPSPSMHHNSLGGHVRRLPEGRVYTKVRVRCDRPLRVSRIIWHSLDGK
jgi:hypothetical protein